MIRASSEFKHLVRNGAKLVNYADIILKDGTVLNLEPSDFSIGGFSLADKTTNGKFEIGTAIAKTINITIANHTNKFSAYDFYKSIIYIYVAVEKEDGTVLKERKGKYYVVNPATPNDTINLSGLDSMYLFDKPFASDLPFPATLEQLLSVCCTDCGVNIGFGQFNNWNMVVYNRPTDCTYRQVVSWIAQIAGYNARISVDDALELVWYDLAILNQNIINGGNFLAYDEETTYDGGDFTLYESDVIIDGGLFTDEVPLNVTKISSLSVSTDDVIITGVRVQNDDVSAFVGTEDYVIEIKDNPLTGGVENAVAEYLAPLLIGLSFRPLSCQTTNNPFFEPFDVCYVYDRKGNGYFTLINSVSYSISGFTTIACNADDPVRNESSYTSESAKAVAQARRNTEAQLTLYDKAVQNMNMLAANAMGLYRESETQSDGSVIYYMSNRPIIKNEIGVCEFELDSVVYKMTGDGFFVSEDGGLSYTSGFDSNGNAVVNVLSAIGITFDWARGGTLSLGGYDNLNGSLVVYDTEKNIIGRFDKDGLFANNGTFKGKIESSDATITGGTINIKTDSEETSVIELSYSTKKLKMTPSYFSIGGNNGTAIIEKQITLGLNTPQSVLLTNELILLQNSISSIRIEPSELVLNNSKLSVLNNSTVSIAGDTKFSGNVKFSSASGVTIDYSPTAKFDVDRNALFSKGVTVEGTFQTKGATKICDNANDTLSFFGGSGSIKKTVANITTTSTATASSVATKLNDLLTALRGYGLVG